MTERPNAPPLRVALPRIAWRLAILAAVFWAVQVAMGWVMAEEAELTGLDSPFLRPGPLSMVLLTYAGLLAIPFVPGIEIGLSLLIVGGAALAPFVYLATALGLSLSYLVGTLISYDWLHRLFADLRLRRVCVMLEEMKPLSQERRLALVRRSLPHWATPLAMRGRYLLLAALLNLPGNALIGGGGGICLIAGVSRLYRPAAALATIALAVLPVPLAVWIFGPELLPAP